MAKPKRGASGLSRLIAVNKPAGITSHDVVNTCRRIFNERRVGHTGTLDPFATGVMLVGIGPATRLDAFLEADTKRYRAGIVFGSATTTDDCTGEVLSTAPVPDALFDKAYAQAQVAALVGRGMQVPPVYSAIKVSGQKAYEQARRGNIIELEPRPYEVFSATLVAINPDAATWVVDLHVSKGTYIRALARDLGRRLNTAAHLGSLQRTEQGAISLEECLTLEELERYPNEATIDPLRALGLRFAFVREASAITKVQNGAVLVPAALALNQPLLPYEHKRDEMTCTPNVFASTEAPRDGECVAVLVENRVQALYEYASAQQKYNCKCMFSIGVERGRNL